MEGGGAGPELRRMWLGLSWRVVGNGVGLEGLRGVRIVSGGGRKALKPL